MILNERVDWALIKKISQDGLDNKSSIDKRIKFPLAHYLKYNKQRKIKFAWEGYNPVDEDIRELVLTESYSDGTGSGVTYQKGPAFEALKKYVEKEISNKEFPQSRPIDRTLIGYFIEGGNKATVSSLNYCLDRIVTPVYNEDLIDFFNMNTTSDGLRFRIRKLGEKSARTLKEYFNEKGINF